MRSISNSVPVVVALMPVAGSASEAGQMTMVLLVLLLVLLPVLVPASVPVPVLVEMPLGVDSQKPGCPNPHHGHQQVRLVVSL